MFAINFKDAHKFQPELFFVDRIILRPVIQPNKVIQHNNKREKFVVDILI